MSDRPIQVGDLVVVIKPTDCCDSPYAVGFIFVVSCIRGGPGTCVHCGGRYERIDACFENKGWLGLDRLKRLDPDALRDDVPADERLKERA